MLDIIKLKLKDAMILKDKNRITTLRNILAKLKLKDSKFRKDATGYQKVFASETLGSEKLVWAPSAGW